MDRDAQTNCHIVEWWWNKNLILLPTSKPQCKFALPARNTRSCSLWLQWLKGLAASPSTRHQTSDLPSESTLVPSLHATLAGWHPKQ